jgi:predicted nucleotidyltransferase
MLSTQPVESFQNLHARVAQLLSEQEKSPVSSSPQLALGLDQPRPLQKGVSTAANSVAEFLNLVSASVPDGDVYLFGGVLRDLALYGKKGFKSDIDLVVEGDWSDLVSYIDHIGARKNKFGGYRLIVGEWPVDIWNAEETWAIKQGHVAY